MESWTGSWLAVAVALAMTTMTMPAMASHNVVGPTASVWAHQADSAPAEIGEEIRPEFHTDAAGSGLIPQARQMPNDATGSAYTDDECTRYQDDPTAYEQELDRLSEEVDEDTPYEDRDTDICWVGYFNVDYLRILASSGFIFFADPLYPVNPAPDDGYCNGDDKAGDPEERVLPPVDDGGPVDQTVADVERINAEECSGSGHDWELDNPYWLALDDDFLEAPVQDDELSPGLEDEVGNEGTQSLTLPGISIGYTLLFGQPHPANENPSPLEAGVGPFSQAPGQIEQGEGGLSFLLGDLVGACEDRTKDCRLLTAEDVKLYDTDRPDVDDDEGLARVCTFSPQFAAVDPADISLGVCGITGDAQTFVGAEQRGGLGIEEGPPTYVSNMPGWHTTMVPIETPYVSMTGGTESYHYFHAVNPAVPTGPDDPLYCVQPGFLAEGDDAIAGVNDPGFYGAYQADAISSHVRHFTAAPLVNDADEIVSGPLDEVTSLAEDLLEEGLDDEQIEDVLNETETLTDLVNETEIPLEELDPVFELANEGLDRTNPFAPGWEKPYNTATAENPAYFTIETEEGVECNNAGDPEISDGSTLTGGLLFDTGITQSTLAVRDATVLDEDGLPQEQSEADRGTWQVDAYSFNGLVKGIMDTSEDEDLADCPEPDGQVQAGQDQCVWEPYWDVYNPNCTSPQDTPCDEVMEGQGYAVHADADGYTPADGTGGLGLVFALTVTGPTLITDTSPDPGDVADGTFEGDSAVLGLGDPTATHCVIGTSQGFDAYLHDHLDAETWLDIAEHVCDGANGQVHAIPDAFSGQGSTARGSFSADIDWAPLAPSAGLVEASLDGFGEDDALCVGSLFSLQDGSGFAGGTGDTLEHELGSSTPVAYGECLDLSSTSGDNAAWSILG